MDKLTEIVELINKASAAIMEIYNANSATVRLKVDNSPITQADEISHTILTQGLHALFPQVPVISEEGNQQHNAAAISGKKFWLVDPIDGTKEFINRSGDFTVCVALVENNTPIFGIIAAPAHDVLYYGGPSMGAYKLTANVPKTIHVAPQPVGVVLGSRSNPDPHTTAFIEQHYPDAQVVAVGSQLKLPYIAEGKADAYPRIGSTMHPWDLAAGHAILAGAGGTVKRPDGSSINYHARDLQVGDFVAQR